MLFKKWEAQTVRNTQYLICSYELKYLQLLGSQSVIEYPMKRSNHRLQYFILLKSMIVRKNWTIFVHHT